MRRMVAGLLCAGLALAAVASSAAAQARGYVGFGVGGSIATGDYADDNKSGVTAHVVAGITGPSGVLGGRINGSFLRHSDKLADDRDQWLGAMADIVFSPGTAEVKARPYFFGGVGFQGGKARTGGTDSETQTDFAWNIGAGLSFKAGTRLSVFLEARWLSISTDAAVFGVDKINLIPISAGIRFGGA